MKKLLILVFTGLFILNLNAQNEKKINIGFKGGLNFADMTKDKYGNLTNNKLTTFNVKAIADAPLINDIIYFQPSFGLSGKGVKQKPDKTESGEHGTIKINPYYAELQANFLFKAPLSDNVKFFVGLGPYASAGLFGKSKIEGYFQGENVSINKNIKFTNSSPDTDETNLNDQIKIKRFDFGYNILTGLEINRYIISVGYEQSFSSIYPQIKGGNSNPGKNCVFNVSIGVFL